MKRILIIAAGLLTAIFLTWSIYVINVNEGFNNFFQTKMDLRSEKEQQLDYLKKHEQEMTDYVKSQNPRIERVEYDWNSIQTVSVGNGTPQGGGEILIIFGYANGSKLTNLKLNFSMDKDKIPDIKSIGSDNLEDIS